MISWKDIRVQEEIRKDHIARAEHARIVKAVNANAEEKSSSKKKPHLGLLAAATRLVKLGDSLRERGTDLALTSREQGSQSNP